MLLALTMPAFGVFVGVGWLKSEGEEMIRRLALSSSERRGNSEGKLMCLD